MAFINFENLPSENTPLTGGEGGNLNVMQEIVNVSNEVDEDYRVNLLEGKNLFNKDNFIKLDGIYISMSNGAIGRYQGNKTLVIQCKPSTTYTIQKISGATFRAGSYATYPNVGTNALTYQINSTGTTITITTGSTAKYLCVQYFGTDDTQTESTILNSIQIEEGSTATTYEPFIPNQIVVDNEKYSDTLNVGASVDSRSRVNVLKSNNLLIPNLISQTLYGLTITKNSDKSYTINGTSTQAFSIEWTTDIFLKKGHYYITFNNKFPINIFFTKQDNTNLVIASSMASDDYFEFDLTEDTTFKSLKSYISRAGIPFDNEIFSPMISTSIPTSYEPYITPSINVDGEEIYSKPVVLWQNSSPTSAFSNQSVSLSDNLTNYKYYEIIYIDTKSSSIYFSTGRLPYNAITYLTIAIQTIRRRYTEPRGTTMMFASAEVFSTYGGSATTNNDNLIPYQILGYK